MVNERRRRGREVGCQGCGFARVADCVLAIDDCSIYKPSRYVVGEVADDCWKDRSTRFIDRPNNGQKVYGGFERTGKQTCSGEKKIANRG